MKKLSLFLVFISLFSVFAAGQQTPANTDLQEAEKLNVRSGEFYARREYDKALEFEQKELGLRVKIGDAQYIAAVNFNIGGIYRETKDFANAIKYFEESLVYYGKAFGENHVKTFTALSNLTHVLFLNDEKTKALETLIRARRIAENLYGKESKPVVDSYLFQAQIYWNMKRLKDVDDAYQQSIFLNDKLLKSSSYDRPDVDQYMCFLATTDSFFFEKRWRKFGEKRDEVNGAEEPSDDIVVGTKAVKLAKPELPPDIKLPSRTILTITRITIDENGAVTNVRLICPGPAIYSKASSDAAYKSKFTPKIKNGVAVKTNRLLIFSYGGNL